MMVRGANPLPAVACPPNRGGAHLVRRRQSREQDEVTPSIRCRGEARAEGNRPHRASRLPRLLPTLAAFGVIAASWPLPAAATTEPTPRQLLPAWRAWRQWTVGDGLPHNTVLAMAQGPDGLIYAGTAEGLARFDGRTWGTVDLPRPVANAAIGAVAWDAGGRLWIATDRHGAWREGNGELRQVPLPFGTQAVSALLPWEGQTMLLGTSCGLYLCDASCQPWDGLEGVAIRSLSHQRLQGCQRLWVGTHGRGLFLAERCSGEPWRHRGALLTRRQSLPNDYVLAITPTSDDPAALWLGTGRGIAHYRNGQVEPYDSSRGLPASMCFSLVHGEDAEGRGVVYGALRSGGLVEIDAQGRWALLDPRHGLPTNAVHTLFQDERSGSLWAGTVGAGVLRSERERWVILDERVGIPDRTVTGIGHLGERLWVGTAQGAVLWQDAAFHPLPLPTNSFLLAAATTPDGRQWLGTSQGLYRLDPVGSRHHYTPDNSQLPAVAVTRLAVRRRPQGWELYIGTNHGLAVVTSADLKVAAVLDAAAPPPEATIVGLVGDHQRVTVATQESLHQVGDSGWYPMPWRAGATEPITAMTADGHGTIWVGTGDGNVVSCDLRQCGLPQPLGQAVGGISHLAASRGDLYVFGSRGGLRLALGHGGAVSTRSRYGVEDGFVPAGVAGVTVDALGRVLAATSLGILAFDPRPLARVTPRIPPPPLRLVGAQYGDPPRPLKAGEKVPAGHNSIVFRYRLLAYEREHGHRYRTQLIGLEGAPTPWTNSAEVSYQRLPPGSYRLRVEAHDARGDAAEPVDFAFTVGSFWWQSPWTYALAALFLVAVGKQLGRWRTRRVEQRAQQLEALVASRTQELAEANRLLEQAAVTDSLTGLKNRRHWQHVVPRIANRAARGQSFLVGLLDIDHFKSINDRLGHDTGDAVLANVAHALSREIRPSDELIRWGGEEFLLVLEGATTPLPVIQRLLQAAARVKIPGDSERPFVTISGGFAQLHGGSQENVVAELEQAIARADVALYAAKHAGRDCAVCLPPERGGSAVTIAREPTPQPDGGATPHGQ